MDIPADDRGFTLGHGLFETVLHERGMLQLWDAHLDRLTRGCAVLGLLAPDRQACREAAEAALAAAGAHERAAVRINWSAGSGGRGLDMPPQLSPRLTATAAPAPATDAPVSLAIVSVRRNDGSPASRLKTLAYLDNVLARAEARAAGADEALMLNTRGQVACAAAANLFWIRHGTVCTPSLDCGVLDGIVRGRVLAACARLGIATAEAAAQPATLRGMPMFLTNSLMGVRAVARLDGREAPASPLVAKIAAAI